jgi:hypothetical protein
MLAMRGQRFGMRWGVVLLPAVAVGLGMWLRTSVPLAASSTTPPNKASPASLTQRTPVPKPTEKPPKNAKGAKVEPEKTDKDAKADKKDEKDEKGEAAEKGEKDDKPKVQEKVTVGVYLKELPDIDVKSNTYIADFYIWFLWKGDTDPTKSWEFVNIIEPNNTSKVAVYTDEEKGDPKPDKLPDGTSYQVYHVQGKFTHPFNLKDYPFDEQDIVLDLEDAEHSIGELVYVIDTEQTAYEPHIDVPGWELRKVNPTISESKYKTNFGDPRVAPGEDSYSRFSFAVHLGRPIKGYMVKTILPVAIIMMITFVAFLIGSAYFEARLGLAITSLISAVALQLTAVSDLPSVGYMVLLDKVYNITYAIIFITLLESVISVKLHDAGKDRAAMLLDRVALVVCFLGFFGGIAAIIALR